MRSLRWLKAEVLTTLHNLAASYVLDKAKLCWADQLVVCVYIILHKEKKEKKLCQIYNFKSVILIWLHLLKKKIL